jgi:hypothetical protein
VRSETGNGCTSESRFNGSGAGFFAGRPSRQALRWLTVADRDPSLTVLGGHWLKPRRTGVRERQQFAFAAAAAVSEASDDAEDAVTTIPPQECWRRRKAQDAVRGVLPHRHERINRDPDQVPLRPGGVHERAESSLPTLSHSGRETASGGDAPSGRTQPPLPGRNRGFDKSDQLADVVSLAGRAGAGPVARSR